MLWLVYRKTRASFGLSFGLILMYGAYNGVIEYNLLLIASGFMLLHLFGDCYNDYWDYGDDKKNKRREKLTITGALTKEQMKTASFAILFFALSILKFTGFFLFLTGIVYALLLWAYSHPRVRLKKYDAIGYALTESPWLIIPALLDNFFSLPHSNNTLLFGFFFFFQYMYLLCQKDSTDLKDTTNLFIRMGWRNASFFCIIFALLSSVPLSILSLSSIALILIWILNLTSKILNISKIMQKTITREERGKLVFLEFLTPYLFVLGVYL